MKSKRYCRPLSPLERYSLVINTVSPYRVDGIIEGDGELDINRLRQAVAHAAEANPAIRVRLRGWLGYCRWVDSGQPPRVYEVLDSLWDGQSEQYMPGYEHRLDAAAGGACSDIFLVHGRDGKLRLLFRGVHAALDGRGMTFWITEVFRALRGEPLLGSGSLLTDQDIQEKFATEVALAPAGPPAKPCIAVVPAAPEARETRFIWRRVILSGHRRLMLGKLACFLAAYARIQSEGDVAFTCPIDYRGLRTQAMSLGNLTGFIRLSIDPDDKPTDVMRQLKHRVENFADCRQIPGIRRIQWIPLAYMARQLRRSLDTILFTPNVHMPTGGVVSMGVLQREDFSCEGFSAHAIYAIPGAVGKLNVVFTEHGSETIITIAAPAAYNHQGQLDVMIHALAQHFKSQLTPVIKDATMNVAGAML